MKRRRSDRIILTPEAAVLKELRLSAGLSMRKAGDLLGKSDTYISHIENGRMDTPVAGKLDLLLSVYGGPKQKSFFDRARRYRAQSTSRQEAIEILSQVSDEKCELFLQLIKNII